MTADQVLAALWRRKVLLGAIAAGVFAAGAAVVMGTPAVYTATAVVRVEPQRPSEEMVQRTVSSPVEQRLLTVRQEMLARPVLQKAIEEMGLYPKIVSERGMEAAVQRMRRDVELKVEGETAFELTYAAEDPQVAARVANRLPALFAEEALRVRREQARLATLLFEEELGVLSKALADWERAIAQFKVDHLGELPEQLEMNMRALDRIGGLLESKSEGLRVAEARRSDLARAHHARDSEAGRLQAALDGTAQALAAARSQWTGDHPEVQRLDREARALRQQLQDAEGRMWAEREERARAAAVVAGLQEEIAGLQRQAEVYQRRLDNTPRWTHELAVLQRDHEIARAKYQSVVSRKVEAEIAQALEARSAPGTFSLISPAGVPVAPSRPDRMGGLMVSLLIALGLSVLVGVILEMRDESLKDTAQARRQLPVPVLAVLPELGGKPGGRRVLMPDGHRGQVNRPPSTLT
jgi:polysaccharide chain length determinant protein (PEP-CTERM system associated)